MSEYLLSVWHVGDYPEPEPEQMQRMFAAVDAFNAEVQAAGAWVFAGGLQPSSSATVVDASSGSVSMTDGPFAEAKEQIGGFWVIDVADLDAALAWAAKGSAACEGPVEVRPFQVEPA
ncbi:MAG: YciI family protein [Actinomycetota bacterium]|nr:YciI family protein [Actinomycetota bacterium]